MLIGKSRRRAKLREQPFPAEWLAIVRTRVPYFSRLTPEDQRELLGHIRVFLAEKRFEGCAGLEITDEIRVTIAAQACVLLLHRDTDYYPDLTAILVYPRAFRSATRHQGPGGLVTEGAPARSGESWKGSISPAGGGPVVLSWDDVRRGAADMADGNNVVFHEFAHQLDGESGSVEGAPRLDQPSAYTSWARALGAEYDRLLVDIAWDRPTLLGGYAATSPAEFFAVATEFFFERPRALKQFHPALYQQLSAYFKQDPAAHSPS